MVRIPFVSVLLLILALPAAPLTAQDDPGPGWRVVPYGGSYWLDDTDGVSFSGNAGAGLRLGPLVGIALDFDAPLAFVGFRVGYDRTIGADFLSGGSAEAAAKSLYLDVRFQPVPRNWPVRPFIFAGAERYVVDVENPRDIPFEVHDTSQLSTRRGIGLDVDLFALRLRTEGVFRHYRSEGDDDPQIKQQNFALVAGVRIPIR